MLRYARVVMLAAAVFLSQCVIMAEDSPSDTIQRIGAGIAQLKDQFPQLRNFSVSEHVHPERLAIEYGYHTHAARNMAGWAGGVPNPDADGVWFSIDFHSPDSLLELDWQPGVPSDCFGDKLVLFLVLEGEKTKSVEAAVWQLLWQQGVKRCPEAVAGAKVKPSVAVQRIGAEIAKLKGKYPQFRQFSVAQNVHSDRLTIEYDYHTHDGRHVGGISALVPDPDDDGVWLYIDFRGPDSSLHGDPNGVPVACLGAQRVSVLILDGKKTKSVSETVWHFLDQQGVKDCPEHSR
jgi:hypothetical protein